MRGRELVEVVRGSADRLQTSSAGWGLGGRRTARILSGEQGLQAEAGLQGERNRHGTVFQERVANQRGVPSLTGVSTRPPGPDRWGERSRKEAPTRMELATGRHGPSVPRGSVRGGLDHSNRNPGNRSWASFYLHYKGWTHYKGRGHFKRALRLDGRGRNGSRAIPVFSIVLD
jgi:hypothetical protein